MNSKNRKIIFLYFYIVILSITVNSEWLDPQGIYNLTMGKETLDTIKEETIEVEKLRVHQIVTQYKPKLKLEHITNKRGGDYDFQPVARYANYEIPIDVNIFRTYETKLVFNQLLWDSNRVKYLVEMQKNEAEIHMADLNIMFIEELNENYQIYFLILGTINKIKLMKELLILIDRTVSTSEVQLSNGLITEIDYKLILNRKKEQEILIREEEHQLQVYEEMLAERLNIDSVQVNEAFPTTPTLEPLEFFLRALEEHNPEVQKQQLKLAQSENGYQSALADRGPYFTLFAQYGLRSNELFSTEDGWMVGFTITQDIFNGKIKKDKINEAQHIKNIQVELVKEVKQKYRLLIQERYRKAVEIQSKLEIKKELVSLLEEKVRMEQKKLDQGTISQLEYLQSITQHNSQQIEYELLKLEYLKSYYDLLLISGYIHQELGK